MALAIWGYYFWFDQVDKPSLSAPWQFPVVRLLLVLTAAGIIREFKISEFPLGPSADEIFTLNNTIDLLNQPFDLFGHTPLFVEGWVETTHLYLYFNLLIVKLFGASYGSMKLFSILPGIISCGAIFLICGLIFDERVAFWTALLFTFAHWPVRLSRYGWDVSFMLMTFAVSLWLLLLAQQRGRPIYAYLSGMSAGVCLYSYLGARICVVSLLAYLLFEWLIDRGRRSGRHFLAFTTGTVLVAFPLLCYYLAHPSAFGIRTAELSVFNSADPLMIIMENIWRHALMFFTRGGFYARDNYPGLAMLDPVTGAFFLLGTAIALRRIKDFLARLVILTLIINFAGGIFSISQEGAPYVYRTAAVMIPVFMISGLGVQWITAQAEKHLPSKRLNLFAWPFLMLTMIMNLYFYFALESKNSAAMRVMAYEPRLVGLEIARDNLAVFLVGRDLLNPIEVNGIPGEEYASANPALILPAEIRKLATIIFSGRYDLNQTLTYNFERPRGIYFVERAALEADNMTILQPAKIIFRSNPQMEETIREKYPGASIREIENIRGEPLFAVLTLLKPTAAVPPSAR